MLRGLRLGESWPDRPATNPSRRKSCSWERRHHERQRVRRQRDAYSWGRRRNRTKTPNTKLQTPEKIQTPNSKLQINTKLQTQTKLALPLRSSGLGIWSFSGAWSLELGAYSWLAEWRGPSHFRHCLFCPSCQFLDYIESHGYEADGDAGGRQHAPYHHCAENTPRNGARPAGEPQGC